jgi:hypothetical protein
LTSKQAIEFSSARIPARNIELDGEEYLIVKEDEVLAIVEEKNGKKPALLKGQTAKTTKTRPKSRKH